MATLPSQPLNLRRSSTVTPVATQISIQWDVPTSNGGSQIVAYTIYWNGGSIGGSQPRDLLATTQSMITFYMVSGLTRGTTYQFAVSASNYVG